MTDRDMLASIFSRAIKKVDPNELADALLQRFHTLPAIFSADESSLLMTPGVNESVVCLILCLAALHEHTYGITHHEFKPRKIRDLPAFLLSLLSGLSKEMLVLLAFDRAGRLCGVKLSGSGAKYYAEVNRPDLFRFAIAHDAVSVVLAHNHPGSHLFPSGADLEITAALRTGFSVLGIDFAGHYLVSGGDVIKIDEVYTRRV